MRQVELIHTASSRRRQLDAGEREAFAEELSRTEPWRGLGTLWAYITGADRFIPPGIAPDIHIIAITNSGRRREFSIYGRTVLRDKATGRSRQFYMGIVLVERVAAAPAGATTTVP